MKLRHRITALARRAVSLPRSLKSARSRPRATAPRLAFGTLTESETESIVGAELLAALAVGAAVIRS